MRKIKLQPSNIEFLKLIRKNNNRDWFNANKDRYLKEHADIIAFADALLIEMNKHDVIETETGKKSLHRIYKDTRFSKEKIPYKSNWSGSFTRATKSRRGGYYFHIEPGNSFAAGGFWGPEPKDLKRIRDEFTNDAGPMRKVLKSKSLISHFGGLQGEQVKTTPKGYEASNPAIDLLRYKQFTLVEKFTDKEILDPDFVKKLNDSFRAMRPFLDVMTDILTTDLNGEPI
ncbi:MAG: DUF2461 domain-containing protein [Bacteroidota bacterium]|nr:DUF2461 domain-containing protein [Bacteroidota bacterium]